MKKVLLLVISLFCISLIAISQTSAESLNVKPGDKLIYEVNFRGDVYNFEVTLKTFDENEISFNYKMPSKGNSANIIITNIAVKSATTYYNYFNGQDQKFADKSTVWLSRKNFNELESGKTGMDVGSGSDVFERKEDASFSFKYNGKEITVNGFRTDNGKSNLDQRQLWILNNKSNPLILRMNLGWTIELKEVTSAQ
jgi:hypothetical protein